MMSTASALVGDDTTLFEDQLQATHVMDVIEQIVLYRLFPPIQSPRSSLSSCIH
jgi:hypothetical protein